jgi:two-component system phosphate regulon response regulator PhoB
MVPIQINELTIDLNTQIVRVGDTQVSLSPTEFGVLAVLASRPGTAFRREEIVERSKGQDYPVTRRSIDVQIVGLRRKLGCSRVRIRTVRGVGYELVDAPPAAVDDATGTD